MAASLSAKAEVVYQFVTAGATDAHVGAITPAGTVALWVYSEGAGRGQTTKLLYYVWGGQGSGNWQGDIPASAVTSNGVNSMHVEVDTCTIDPTSGCGYVNLTWNKTPGQAVVGTLTSHTAYDGTIYQSAGVITMFPATAVGTVLGITVDSSTNDGSTNADIGTANGVTVTVTKP
jgi:hypothetical protein